VPPLVFVDDERRDDAAAWPPRVERARREALVTARVEAEPGPLTALLEVAIRTDAADE
jgi:hypothetical protein